MVEPSDHAEVDVNPFVIGGSALILALALQRLVSLPFIPLTTARFAGAVVFLLGIAFGLPAARLMRATGTTFNPSRPATALLTRGPFRVSRNRIYVAMLLGYTGLSIFLGTPWGLLLIAPVIWLMDRWVIIPEEEYLGRKFGEAYAEYRPIARRWL